MKLNKTVRIPFYLLCIFIISGCMPVKNFFSPSDRGWVSGIPPYSGLKAKIAVAGFESQTPRVGPDTAASLRDMFVESLAPTNRFIIVDKQNQGADLVVSVTVTEFTPEVSGGKSGVGGGGGSSNGAFGGLMSGGLNKANISLDIRLVNASTSEVISTKLVQAQASDATGPAHVFTEKGPYLKNGLSVYIHTPMEKAICLGIIEADRYIVQAVPQNYYKYKN